MKKLTAKKLNLGKIRIASLSSAKVKNGAAAQAISNVGVCPTTTVIRTFDC